MEIPHYCAKAFECELLLEHDFNENYFLVIRYFWLVAIETSKELEKF